MAIPRISRTATILTLIIVLLVPVVTLVGLLVPSFYRDTAWMIPQARGQDLITLVVAEPLLVGALIAARWGRVSARLILMGALGYVLYTYAMFSYTAYFNRLFLVYVALLSASLFALVSLVGPGNYAGTVEAQIAARPARTVAAFCALVGFFFLVAWLGQIIPAIVRGTVPAPVLLAKTPTSAAHVQDLAVIIPLFFLAAIWLWQRRPRGASLAVVLLDVADIMLLAILAMGLFSAQAGITGALDLYWLFVVLAAASLGFTALALILPQRTAVPRRDVAPEVSNETERNAAIPYAR